MKENILIVQRFLQKLVFTNSQNYVALIWQYFFKTEHLNG